jgi:hypothetical protein
MHFVIQMLRNITLGLDGSVGKSSVIGLEVSRFCSWQCYLCRSPPLCQNEDECHSAWVKETKREADHTLSFSIEA